MKCISTRCAKHLSSKVCVLSQNYTVVCMTGARWLVNNADFKEKDVYPTKPTKVAKKLWKGARGHSIRSQYLVFCGWIRGFFLQERKSLIHSLINASHLKCMWCSNKTQDYSEKHRTIRLQIEITQWHSWVYCMFRKFVGLCAEV